MCQCVQTSNSRAWQAISVVSFVIIFLTIFVAVWLTARMVREVQTSMAASLRINSRCDPLLAQSG